MIKAKGFKAAAISHTETQVQKYDHVASAYGFATPAEPRMQKRSEEMGSSGPHAATALAYDVPPQLLRDSEDIPAISPSFGCAGTP